MCSLLAEAGLGELAVGCCLQLFLGVPTVAGVNGDPVALGGIRHDGLPVRQIVDGLTAACVHGGHRKVWVDVVGILAHCSAPRKLAVFEFGALGTRDDLGEVPCFAVSAPVPGSRVEMVVGPVLDISNWGRDIESFGSRILCTVVDVCVLHCQLHGRTVAAAVQITALRRDAAGSRHLRFFVTLARTVR